MPDGDRIDVVTEEKAEPYRMSGPLFVFIWTLIGMAVGFAISYLFMTICFWSPTIWLTSNTNASAAARFFTAVFTVIGLGFSFFMSLKYNYHERGRK